ncbi:hypothetical protein B0H17DRAFT_1208886 [Mycena rosella]|uniref:Uncharacterized protein n=1 Tax=Mycena rosella TaxID=1033263 RepID=A0AAD7CZT4_MYCRO|nr:hypothetical protein B0H17DRAFT_1208886 [Mycena rosella]
MADFATSDADRLRIAIALTALKFKPMGQSCAAYVLELRSLFPPSTPAAPTADGSWKNHALALEMDLAALKAKYEAEQIKTVLAATAPPTEIPASGSQPPKRKPKKKPTDQRPDPPARASLETVLEDLNAQPDFVALPTSDSLFSTFSSFQQLTCALASSSATVTAAQRSLLLSTTTRALTALANILQPILCSAEITVPSQAATLQTVAILVHYLVSSSLPYLLRKSKQSTNQPATVSSLLNKLLDALITLIFHPVLESFTPLSQRYLTSLFSPTSPAALPADLRLDVLHIFQSAFSPLVSSPSGFEVNLRGTLALNALRELESLFAARITDGGTRPWTHDTRVNSLARQDALWYHCTALHILFTPPKDSSTLGSPVCADGAVSERQIVDALSRILSRCRASTKFGSVSGTTDTCNGEIPARDSDIDDTPNDLDREVVDEVGYGMILGVIERYWRWTGEVPQDAAP